MSFNSMRVIAYCIKRPVSMAVGDRHMNVKQGLKFLHRFSSHSEGAVSTPEGSVNSSVPLSDSGIRSPLKNKATPSGKTDCGSERLPGQGLSGRSDWFYPSIHNVPERTWELFNHYCEIPRNDIPDHWERMREKAFAVFPYPCIGQHRFLNLTLSTHFLYPEIIKRLQDPLSSGIETQNLIDIGCCMGQDLRKLVHDGVPAEKLTGLDRDSRFIDLSFELFRDRTTLGANFITVDLMTEESRAGDELGGEITQLLKNNDQKEPISGPNPSYIVPPTENRRVKLVDLQTLYGQYDIIVATSFFHLYNLQEQLALARRVARMMRRRPGSLIAGRQVGSVIPGEYKSISENEHATRFAHDATTWRALWDRVGVEIASDEKEQRREGILSEGDEFRGFDVETRIDTEELGKGNSQGQSWSEPNIRRMLFSIRRL